jgi:hypothetical protein
MRIGNITSSEIVALTANGRAKDSIGKDFYTYVKQCIWERRLGKTLDRDVNSKSMTWGKLAEMYFFFESGKIHYTPMMNEVVKHPTIGSWVGSPDGINNKMDCVTELKSPYTLASYCVLVEPMYKGLEGIEAMDYIKVNHKDGKKYYWQCVSNAILTGKKKAEFVVYCPYLSVLPEIRMLANNAPTEELSNYYWIAYGSDKDLPHILDESKYKDEYSLFFDIPEEDIDFLTNRVKLAEEMILELT